MKKSLFGVVAAATLLFASCAKDEVQVAPAPEQAGDFTAVVVGSRAELNDKAVLWNDTDLLSIFTKTAHNRQYKVKQIEEGSRSATFEYVSYSGTDVTPLTANYALYPYDPAATISGDQIKTTLAAEQTYNAAKIDLGNALMVAKSSDNTLTFMNAGALLCFKVSKQALPDSYTLQSIKVSSTNKALAGEVTIDLANDGKAVVADDGAKAVTLATINAAITTTEQAFYLALPETTFAEGDATVTFTFNEGEKTIALPPFTLSQNSIKNVVYEIKADDFTGSTGQYDEVWDGETITPVEPDASGVYVIDSPAKLAWLGSFKSGSGLTDATIELVADMNMNGGTFNNLMLSGTSVINGNNHTIKNVRFVEAPYADGSNSGHNGQAAGAGFVYVPSKATVSISNLTIEQASSQGVMHDHGSGGAGIVSTYVQGSLTLNKVAVKGATVNGVYALGALVGEVNDGTLHVSDCSVDGATISNTDVSDESGLMGGLVGRVSGVASITNSSVANATINAYVATASDHKRTVGYFVGNFVGGDTAALTITNSSVDEATCSIVAKNVLAQTEQNLYGVLLGGWRGTKGSVVIDGVSLVGASNDAVKAAWQQGGTIALPAGTFDINVSPKAGAVIKGAGKDKTIINLSDLEYGVQGAIAFEDLTIKKGNSDYTGFAHTTTESYTNCKIEGVLFLYAENSTFTQCEFVQTGNQYNVWTYAVKNAEFDQCTFNTAGKALLIYNEGAGASNVTVTGCKFYATTGAKASAISNQNCAAIELDNFGGMAHTLTTSGNSYDGGDKFSGEWRIKRCLDGSPITVNGTEYNQLAIDGKLMTISGTIVTVEGE